MKKTIIIAAFIAATVLAGCGTSAQLTQQDTTLPGTSKAVTAPEPSVAVTSKPEATTVP